jgi:hypothetical protein
MPINSLARLAQYGNRYGTNTPKQAGYFGELPLQHGGVATEYSVGQTINGKNVEMPSLVPTLSYEEMNAVLNSADNGAKLPDSVYQKALEHARQRGMLGMSPFWAIPEKQYERPKPNTLLDLLNNGYANNMLGGLYGLGGNYK